MFVWWWWSWWWCCCCCCFINFLRMNKFYRDLFYTFHYLLFELLWTIGEFFPYVNAIITLYKKNSLAFGHWLFFIQYNSFLSLFLVINCATLFFRLHKKISCFFFGTKIKFDSTFYFYKKILISVFPLILWIINISVCFSLKMRYFGINL